MVSLQNGVPAEAGMNMQLRLWQISPGLTEPCVEQSIVQDKLNCIRCCLVHEGKPDLKFRLVICTCSSGQSVYWIAERQSDSEMLQEQSQLTRWTAKYIFMHVYGHSSVATPGRQCNMIQWCTKNLYKGAPD